MRRSSAPPTTHDVARLAGVSRATVSFVLNGVSEGRVAPETQKRVLSAAATLGYRPNRLASALSTGRTYTIGIVSEVLDYRYVAATAASYTKNMMLAVSVAAARAGLNALLFLETGELPLKPETVADGRVDGILVFGMYQSPEKVQKLATLGVPCVEIGTRWGNYYVEADNTGGARLAVEHLYDLGHRRIAHYIGLPPGITVPSSEQRRESFLQTAAELGLSEAKTPVAHEAADLAALFPGPAPCASDLTAIFCYNEAAAVEALDILRAAGRRVPEDVSLIGFDNELRGVVMRPALTTVVNPIDEIAIAAVGLLCRQMAGEAEPQEAKVLPTSLIVRDSTAEPPSNFSVSSEPRTTASGSSMLSSR